MQLKDLVFMNIFFGLSGLALTYMAIARRESHAASESVLTQCHRYGLLATAQAIHACAMGLFLTHSSIKEVAAETMRWFGSEPFAWIGASAVVVVAASVVTTPLAAWSIYRRPSEISYKVVGMPLYRTTAAYRGGDHTLVRPTNRVYPAQGSWEKVR